MIYRKLVICSVLQWVPSFSAFVSFVTWACLCVEHVIVKSVVGCCWCACRYYSYLSLCVWTAAHMQSQGFCVKRWFWWWCFPCVFQRATNSNTNTYNNANKFFELGIFIWLVLKKKQQQHDFCFYIIININKYIFLLLCASLQRISIFLFLFLSSRVPANESRCMSFRVDIYFF